METNDIAGVETGSSSGPGRSVFLLDDAPSDREAFSRIVGQVRGGCSCRLFSRGEDLLESLLDVLRGAPPPLACFIDVKMSGMSGLDVLRWIRAQPALHRIPVIMLSDSEHPEYLTQAWQLGAQCYVAKFPSVAALNEILTAAEQHAKAACGEGSFGVSCNLLSGQREAVT